MYFCEKLDLLMNITNTSNSTLAMQTSLDASHVSRLRRGERNMPRSEAVLQNMSAYFARHCAEEYQQKALADTLKCFLPLPGEAQLAEQIFSWLSGEYVGGFVSVETFLRGFGSAPKAVLPLSAAGAPAAAP